MSTPLETNTEELQEILRQVYDLPDRSSVGGGYDLEIGMSGMWDRQSPLDEACTLSFSYDQEQVAAVCEKLVNGENPSVIVRGADVAFDSGGSYELTFQPFQVRGSAWDYQGTTRCYRLWVYFAAYNSSQNSHGTFILDIKKKYTGEWSLNVYYDRHQLAT